MYSTKDLCQAATLVSIDIPLHDMKPAKEKGKIVATFEFEETPDIKIAIRSYWDKKLRVEPRTYFTNLKDLKGRIYESKQA